jgi:hypothetical protein
MLPRTQQIGSKKVLKVLLKLKKENHPIIKSFCKIMRKMYAESCWDRFYFSTIDPLPEYGYMISFH